MKEICVIGSLNVDLTLRIPHFHQPGETITAKSISRYPGGKGGNQAVAVANLGAPVSMVGMLGDDENGMFYRTVLEKAGVDHSNVGTAPGTSSGTALIEVDDHGENRIAILAGANALVSRQYTDGCRSSYLRADIFLMQYEISLDTVQHVARDLFQQGKTVILDPAPALPTPKEIFSHIHYLTPNSTELSMLTGMPAGTDEEITAAARCILAKGVHAVIAKLGDRGCLYVDEKNVLPVPGFQVDCVDTTAAGDSFNAGFAVALRENMPLWEALRFANAVGALSVMGAGAQSSMPSRVEVEAFLRHQAG